MVAIGAAGTALVALLAVTQISDASTRRWPWSGGGKNQGGACATVAAPATTAAGTKTQTAKPQASGSQDTSQIDKNAGDVVKPGQTAGDVYGGNQNNRRVTNHVGDGQVDDGTRIGDKNNCGTTTKAPGNGGGGGQTTKAPGNGTTSAAGGNQSSGATSGASTGATTKAPLQTLGDKCQGNSKLQLHTGFQDGNRCVATEFGEVTDRAKNPPLLIAQFPNQVRVGQAFTLRISTRNLVRDRFLAAAQGGYYKESSFLNGDGLTRGHFHTACRMLDNTREAPDPTPLAAFFVATEDGGGNGRPDQVTINVTGMPTAGTAQCASWAGDGSHRIPMMQFANEIPAIDVVRITVR